MWTRQPFAARRDGRRGHGPRQIRAGPGAVPGDLRLGQPEGRQVVGRHPYRIVHSHLQCPNLVGVRPRDAAIAIVRRINSPNQQQALLALSLLDICVKNCGYPFHLQVASKEFLNELVRRFPANPPVRLFRWVVVIAWLTSLFHFIQLDLFILRFISFAAPTCSCFLLSLLTPHFTSNHFIHQNSLSNQFIQSILQLPLHSFLHPCSLFLNHSSFTFNTSPIPSQFTPGHTSFLTFSVNNHFSSNRLTQSNGKSSNS